MLWNDLASWTYAYTIVIGSYGFILFLYWALRQGGASAWFIYVMLLLLSMTVTSAFQLVARYYLMTQDTVAYTELLTNISWAAKGWIASLTMTFIAIHATWKLRKNKQVE